MKLSKFLLGVAICTASSLLWVSCKKSDIVPQSQPTNQANLKNGGYVPDNPSAIAKVPVLISANFLKTNKEALLADPLNLNGQVNTQASRVGKTGGDKTAPIVSITSPSNSSTVSGTVTIQVSASDNVGVSQVSASIDGVALSTSTTAPYSFSWNTSGVASGTHTISATAKDAAGNSSTTSIQVGINATVSGDVTAPTVSITSPASGSSVTAGATVTVAVSTSDNVGVSAVNFSLDGALQGTSSTSPYSFSWNTTNVASGTHTLTATAIDAAGNTASYSILVTINTTIIASTTLPTSYQLVMPPVGQQGGEFSCVAWAVATTRSEERYYKTNATTYSYSENIFSPEYIYNQAKASSDCSSGSGIYTCLNIIKNQGVCTWQTMPYSDTNGCSLMPNSTQTTEGANYKIGSFALVMQDDQVGIKTLLSQNHSLIAGTSIDDNFTNATAGFIWKSFSGTYGTNHGYVICGYDDAKHAYKIMNSWGTSWGELGYTWIDYDFFGTLPGSVYVMQNAM